MMSNAQNDNLPIPIFANGNDLSAHADSVPNQPELRSVFAPRGQHFFWRSAGIVRDMVHFLERVWLSNVFFHYHQRRGDRIAQLWANSEIRSLAGRN